MLNIAVFGSGRGSNFRAILDAVHRGAIKNACIRLVVSNNSDAGILRIAEMNSTPSLHISQKQFGTEAEFVARILDELSDHEINFIVLAGYMKRLPPALINEFRGRIINIHPALLPKYGGLGMYGMHVHEAVLAAGDRISGATVHLVDEDYDHGAIVLQRKLDVIPGETPESLAERVLKLEHQLYPEAIRLFAEGKTIDTQTDVAVYPS